MAETNGNSWPEGVKPITFDDAKKLGVGPDGRLYWDGVPLKTEQHLILSVFQKITAVLTAAAIIIGGFAQAAESTLDFGCKLHWWSACAYEQKRS